MGFGLIEAMPWRAGAHGARPASPNYPKKPDVGGMHDTIRYTYI
jgi:hypothetical protein